MKKLITMLTIAISLSNAFSQNYNYVNISEQELKDLNSYKLRRVTIRNVIKTTKDGNDCYIATDTIVDYKSLAGDYRIVDSVYGLCPIDISSYVDYKKDELVDYNTLHQALYDSNLDRYFPRIELYQKIGTDIYIGDVGELFARISTSIPKPGTKTESQKLSEYLQLLNSKGYATFEVGDDVYITTKFGKVLASGEMYSEVQNGNFSYIDEIANSVKQYKSLSIQAKPFITKLSNHYSAHLNKTMTKTRMTIWRNDAKLALSIFNKIRNLKGIDTYNFLKNIDDTIVNSTIEFIQAVNGTRQVLGI